MLLIDWLHKPWPWYVSGPLIGLTVPTLLILGNKPFGISSSLRHVCAALIPSNIAYFRYNWKVEVWNLVFVVGVGVGGYIAAHFLSNPHPIQLNPLMIHWLKQHGITPSVELLPIELFSWHTVFTIKGMVLFVIGGFLVGFGTRYAGGCTSGHSIMGLSNLQWPSLVATIAFMIGGFIMANCLVPYILQL